MKLKIKKIWNTVTTLLVALVMLPAALLWGPRLLGLDVFVVQSGSMEPAYHVGSVVYVKDVQPETLKNGDVITFNISSTLRGTHRIMDVIEDENGLSFQTKGDANNAPDGSPVKPEDIVGKVVMSVPLLGFLAASIQQPPGSYLTFCAVAVLLLLIILPDLIFTEKTEKETAK